MSRAARVAALTGILTFAAGLIAYLWFGSTDEQTHPTAPGGSVFAISSVARAIPEVTFQDEKGHPHSLADFRGKLVLFNLWATWCAPCREEMPALDRLQQKIGGPGFQVMTLSIDQQGPQVVRKFFDETGIKALELYSDPSGQAAFKLGAVGLPMTLLIDRSGREIGRRAGPANWDASEVVADLQRYLEAQP